MAKKNSNSRNKRRLAKKTEGKIKAAVGQTISQKVKELRAEADKELAIKNDELKKTIRDDMVNHVVGQKEIVTPKLPLLERISFKLYMIRKLFSKMINLGKLKVGVGSATPDSVGVGFNAETGDIALRVVMANGDEHVIKMGHKGAESIRDDISRCLTMINAVDKETK
jgi:hypothetical protein